MTLLMVFFQPHAMPGAQGPFARQSVVSTVQTYHTLLAMLASSKQDPSDLDAISNTLFSFSPYIFCVKEGLHPPHCFSKILTTPVNHLEKEKATHSSTLPGKSHGWRSLLGYSPWRRKESDRTEQLHFTHLTHFILYHWRRKWQPTPVFLPGESQRSFAGHGPWGRRQSDTTEVTKHAVNHFIFFKTGESSFHYPAPQLWPLFQITLWESSGNPSLRM